MTPTEVMSQGNEFCKCLLIVAGSIGVIALIGLAIDSIF